MQRASAVAAFGLAAAAPTHADGPLPNVDARITGFNGPNYERELGCGPRHAIDLEFERGWLSDAIDPRPEGLIPGRKFIVIRLPRAVNITSFGLDPTETCGMDRSTALKAFTIQTRTSPRAAWATAVVRNRALRRHRLNVLRPARGRRHVRFVRLVMRSNRHRRPRDDGANFMAISELTVRGARTQAP